MDLSYVLERSFFLTHFWIDWMLEKYNVAYAEVPNNFQENYKILIFTAKPFKKKNVFFILHDINDTIIIKKCIQY